MTNEKPFISPKNNQEKSSISRIIGLSKQEAQEVLDFFKEKFENPNVDEFEIEKSPEVKEIIDNINNLLKEFLEGYGVNFTNVPEKNIHIVDKAQLPEKVLELKSVKKNNGFFLLNEQQIIILKNYREGEKMGFLQTLVHEIIHLNSYQTLEKSEGKNGEITLVNENDPEDKISISLRRSGLLINSKENKVYFTALNEAITQKLTHCFDEKYFFKIPQIREEHDNREEFKDFLTKKGKSSKYISRVKISQNENGQWHTKFENYSYLKETQEIDRLIENLYSKNTELFNSKEDVFKLFVNAYFKGELLQLARLIEKTYGKGYFREMGDDGQQK